MSLYDDLPKITQESPSEAKQQHLEDSQKDQKITALEREVLDLKEQLAIDEDSDEYNKLSQEKLIEQNHDLRSNRELREKTSKEAFEYLWFITLLVFGIFLLDGFLRDGFSLGTPVLTTLAGGTFASAIGLPAIAMNGLFKSKSSRKTPKSKKKKK